ncbi:hypothetical protein SDC9_133254 [bioreactor metagenome]|uniref:Uncharacterized protein n=1 Tax=bioreactor metagenome TaxID=1076179 RepID=A0A645DAE4_9ZZZZ
MKLLLGHVHVVGFVRQINRSLSAECGERNAPVHGSRLFGVQMQIELLRLPSAVLGYGVGVLRGVRRERYGFEQAMCGCAVRAVAVFAVHIVGNDDFRLKPSNQFHERRNGVLLAPALQSVFERRGVRIPKRQKHRRVANAKVPKSGQRLVHADSLAVCHVGNLNRKPALARVGGNRSAKVEQLVVTVRRDDQEIRFLERRLPVEHALRQFTRRIER